MSKTCSLCTFLFDTSGLIPESNLPDDISLRCMKEEKFVGGWPPPVRDPSNESCEKFVEFSPQRPRWEWDDNKNRKNIEKHGISFQDAVSALDLDENSVRYVGKSWESLDSLDYKKREFSGHLQTQTRFEIYIFLNTMKKYGCLCPLSEENLD